MKAFLITCNATKDRLPYAKRILSNNCKLTSVQIIKTYDACRINADYLSKIDPVLWQRRIFDIRSILLDNAQQGGQRINNGKKYVNVAKQDLENIVASCHAPQWLEARDLSHGEISVLLKHFCALVHISEGIESHGMIVEDDILSHSKTDSFFDSLMHFINSNDPDYIDIAGGANLKADDARELLPVFTKIQPPRTRTNAGYIVSKMLAQLFVENFFPLVFPIDWHLQYFLYRYANYPIHCYWMEEPVYLHGSESSHYKSWRS